MEIIKKTFTPKEAEQILATRNNVNVKKKRKNTVQNYARQMLDGKWHNSWDCLAFDKNGDLLNGQHRLAACVLAQVPFTAYVILDAEDITGDMGLKRNAVETLKGFGLEMPAPFNSNFGVGVIRDVAKIYFGVNNATPDECYEYANYTGMSNCADIVTTIKSAPVGVAKATVVSAIIGGWVVTRDKRVLTFCEVLSTGISNDVPCGGVIAIRDWLMKNNMRKVGRSFGRNDGMAVNVRAMVQAALRGYLNGLTAKRVVTRTDLIYKPTQDMFMEEW